MLGHREEKCHHSGGGYGKEVVEKFQRVVLNMDGVRGEIARHAEKRDVEKQLWIMNKCIEIEKVLPQKRSLMVGRTEIPK